VLLASLGQISVGRFLLAIVIPGLLAATLIALYIVIRGVINPELAPMYDAESVSLAEKLKLTVLYILPLGLILFLVIGLIILGVATPTESAALGALGSFILAALYRSLTVEVMVNAFSGTLKITTMILFIIAGSTAFSQILSFTGVSSQLVQMVGGLAVSALVILLVMQLIVLIMGTFMEPVSIMLIVLPIFMPIAQTLGFDLLWFATLLLINIEVGLITPPFGIGLFAMKGAAPADTTMTQIYSAAFPMIVLYLILMALLIALPSLATWLPSLLG
jgi:tripartite ATP-independent transporter DctM subunit